MGSRVVNNDLFGSNNWVFFDNPSSADAGNSGLNDGGTYYYESDMSYMSEDYTGEEYTVSDVDEYSAYTEEDRSLLDTSVSDPYFFKKDLDLDGEESAKQMARRNRFRPPNFAWLAKKRRQRLQARQQRRQQRSPELHSVNSGKPVKKNKKFWWRNRQEQRTVSFNDNANKVIMQDQSRQDDNEKSKDTSSRNIPGLSESFSDIGMSFDSMLGLNSRTAWMVLNSELSKISATFDDDDNANAKTRTDDEQRDIESLLDKKAEENCSIYSTRCNNKSSEDDIANRFGDMGMSVNAWLGLNSDVGDASRLLLNYGRITDGESRTDTPVESRDEAEKDATAFDHENFKNNFAFMGLPIAACLLGSSEFIQTSTSVESDDIDSTDSSNGDAVYETVVDEDTSDGDDLIAIERICSTDSNRSELVTIVENERTVSHNTTDKDRDITEAPNNLPLTSLPPVSVESNLNEDQQERDDDSNTTKMSIPVVGDDNSSNNKNNDNSQDDEVASTRGGVESTTKTDVADSSSNITSALTLDDDGAAPIEDKSVSIDEKGQERSASEDSDVAKTDAGSQLEERGIIKRNEDTTYPEAETNTTTPDPVTATTSPSSHQLQSTRNETRSEDSTKILNQSLEIDDANDRSKEKDEPAEFGLNDDEEIECVYDEKSKEDDEGGTEKKEEQRRISMLPQVFSLPATRLKWNHKQNIRSTNATRSIEVDQKGRGIGAPCVTSQIPKTEEVSDQPNTIDAESITAVVDDESQCETILQETSSNNGEEHDKVKQNRVQKPKKKSLLYMLTHLRSKRQKQKQKTKNREEAPNLSQNKNAEPNDVLSRERNNDLSNKSDDSLNTNAPHKVHGEAGEEVDISQLHQLMESNSDQEDAQAQGGVLESRGNQGKKENLNDENKVGKEENVESTSKTSQDVGAVSERSSSQEAIEAKVNVDANMDLSIDENKIEGLRRPEISCDPEDGVIEVLRASSTLAVSSGCKQEAANAKANVDANMDPSIDENKIEENEAKNLDASQRPRRLEISCGPEDGEIEVLRASSTLAASSRVKQDAIDAKVNVDANMDPSIDENKIEEDKAKNLDASQRPRRLEISCGQEDGEIEVLRASSTLVGNSSLQESRSNFDSKTTPQGMIQDNDVEPYVGMLDQSTEDGYRSKEDKHEEEVGDERGLEVCTVRLPKKVVRDWDKEKRKGTTPKNFQTYASEVDDRLLAKKYGAVDKDDDDDHSYASSEASVEVCALLLPKNWF